MSMFTLRVNGQTHTVDVDPKMTGYGISYGNGDLTCASDVSVTAPKARKLSRACRKLTSLAPLGLSISSNCRLSSSHQHTGHISKVPGGA
jgi:hypothetical protein